MVELHFCCLGSASCDLIMCNRTSFCVVLPHVCDVMVILASTLLGRHGYSSFLIAVIVLLIFVNYIIYSWLFSSQHFGDTGDLMIFFMLSWRCLLKAQPLLSWFCRLTPGCHAGLYLAVVVVMVTHGCHAGLYLAVMVVMVTPG